MENLIELAQSSKLRDEMTSLKILLVDDEPDILEFLKYNLLQEDYQVFTAENGIEGIRIAEKEMNSSVITHNFKYSI